MRQRFLNNSPKNYQPQKQGCKVLKSALQLSPDGLLLTATSGMWLHKTDSHLHALCTTRRIQGGLRGLHFCLQGFLLSRWTPALQVWCCSFDVRARPGRDILVMLDPWLTAPIGCKISQLQIGRKVKKKKKRVPYF